MNKPSDTSALPTSDEAAYEADFALWRERQSELLRARQFNLLDIANLLEELDAMGRNERRELQSRLAMLLIHLLKCRYQPGRKSTSWIATIGEQRHQIELLLAESPSLRPLLASNIASTYPAAVKRAAMETGLAKATFPFSIPFTDQQVVDLDYLP